MPSPTLVSPLAYTIEEVAEALRIGRSSVYAMIASGELDTVRVGRHLGAIRVPVKSLEQWVQNASNRNKRNESHE